jgi:hypothetical protein
MSAKQINQEANLKLNNEVMFLYNGFGKPIKSESDIHNIDSKINQYKKELNLDYCVWHSGIFPTPEEVNIENNTRQKYNNNKVPGFNTEQIMKFVWKTSNKACYDNCNYKKRLDIFTKNRINAENLIKDTQNKLDNLVNNDNQIILLKSNLTNTNNQLTKLKEQIQYCILKKQRYDVAKTNAQITYYTTNIKNIEHSLDNELRKKANYNSELKKLTKILDANKWI